MLIVKIVVYCKVDGRYCDSLCDLRSHRNYGDWWDFYCTVFNRDLGYDKNVKKHIRCDECVENEERYTKEGEE